MSLKAKITGQLKAKAAGEKLNLSQKRIDAIVARVEKGLTDEWDDSQIDERLEEINELAPFKELAALDDHNRTKAKKVTDDQKEARKRAIEDGKDDDVELPNNTQKKGMKFIELSRVKVFDNEFYSNIRCNLVSSVGFVIARNGKTIQGYFPVVATGAEGKELVENLAKCICGKDEVEIVLVAGENYVRYVQSNSNDVITGSLNRFIGYIKQLWRGYK